MACSSLERVMFARELCQCALPLPHEVLQQRIGRRRDAKDGQREERDNDALGNVGRVGGEGGIDGGGERDEADEGHEPGKRLARPDDQQSTQR